MSTETILNNYINNEWRRSSKSEYLDVTNPATAEVLGAVPLSPGTEVDLAAAAAADALVEWRRTPAPDRVQYLFKLKNLLEENFDDIARTITLECGKTLDEAQGEMRRAIENVEVACGISTLMQGYNLEDIATGIDEIMIRQPVGVCAAIAPFNFPRYDHIVVHAVCDRLRQHLHRQAFGESAADDAEDFSTHRKYRAAQRCRQSGERFRSNRERYSR